MNPLAVIALGGAAIWALSKYAKAASISAMRFLITGVNIGLDGLSPVIKIDILIQNPTDKQIDISSMAGDAYVNGTFVGNISNFQPTVITPNTEVETQVRVRINVSGIVTQVIDIITGAGGVAAVIKLVGTANVDHTLIPIDLTYKLI